MRGGATVRNASPPTRRTSTFQYLCCDRHDVRCYFTHLRAAPHPASLREATLSPQEAGRRGPSLRPELQADALVHELRRIGLHVMRIGLDDADLDHLLEEILDSRIGHR